MKSINRFLSLFLALTLLASMSAVLFSCNKDHPLDAPSSKTKQEDIQPPEDESFSDFETNGDLLALTRGDITVQLDPESGMLYSISSSENTVFLSGIVADAGIDGKQVLGQISYRDLSSLATYELPAFAPKSNPLPEYKVEEIKATKEGFTVSLLHGKEKFTYNYKILSNMLALDVTISTESTESLRINGVTFLVRGIEDFDIAQTTYEFPGSTPEGKFTFADSKEYRATCSDYCSPAVVIESDGIFQNILFVNEIEKWTAGCYYDSSSSPCVGFISATEGYLSASAPMTVGTLYIPLDSENADPYESISKAWSSLGYRTPEYTATDDLYAIYSGHPYGTMDTEFSNKWSLGEYADRMDSVAGMGFDAVWLLPVFSHSGNNVYEPIDQGIIDSRYGGIEGARTFIDKAHSLGMSVLFDFVPHGPRPVYSFAREHDAWISKDINGNNQIEWDCVSFDYNHPEYYEYNLALAKYYAEELGLDGARIDCSMGGLPNWSSAAGLRASASGLLAGLNVSKALREGFDMGGANTLILPENFHPSPAFASVTDVFYDMPLYRCLHDLNNKHLGETEYVKQLTDYLIAENGSSVAGQLKLRFLGNHDTVTWTFDAERAQTLYGTEKAKALWMTIGWIDGVLYIYQGDEYPETYGLEGENLESFFEELIEAKRTYLPNSMETEYIKTDSPIFAFYRHDEENARLVLVNLSDKEQSYALDGEKNVLTSIGTYFTSENEIVLEPYSGVILDTDMTNIK